MSCPTISIYLIKRLLILKDLELLVCDKYPEKSSWDNGLSKIFDLLKNRSRAQWKFSLLSSFAVAETKNWRNVENNLCSFIASVCAFSVCWATSAMRLLRSPGIWLRLWNCWSWIPRWWHFGCGRKSSARQKPRERFVRWNRQLDRWSGAARILH